MSARTQRQVQTIGIRPEGQASAERDARGRAETYEGLEEEAVLRIVAEVEEQLGESDAVEAARTKDEDRDADGETGHARDGDDDAYEDGPEAVWS